MAHRLEDVCLYLNSLIADRVVMLIFVTQLVLFEDRTVRMDNCSGWTQPETTGLAYLILSYRDASTTTPIATAGHLPPATLHESIQCCRHHSIDTSLCIGHRR